ncbi:MAG TPA: tripartite tricarboxylate transporter substrate binding protein [Burkholderiales bacterium]|nr:tripartite tricarboxylate transporter substrate binding protein [Burkholderiales bacterium]
MNADRSATETRHRLADGTTAIVLLALTISAGALQAAEASYPTRPIRLVVGFPPGGGLDALARIIGPKLADAMGQNWVIDNRPGAGGNLGGELVARANPDGYTVLMALSSQLTVNPSLYRQMPFNAETDLQPVTKLVTAEHILIVNPSVPARTLKEFIAFARQNPGSLRFASAGVGSSLHMAAELLKKRAGIDMVHVPYKGAGPSIAALLSGECQVLTGTVSSTIQFISAGRLRGLASLGARRSKVLPDLPTVAESGYPGFEADAWYALLVPARTPQSIVQRIHAEALKALQYPDVQAALASQGLAPETDTPAELAARIRREAGVWAGVIKDAGISAQ